MENEEDLSHMTRELQEEYETAGRTINVLKREHLIVGKDEICGFSLEISKPQ